VRTTGRTKTHATRWAPILALGLFAAIATGCASLGSHPQAQPQPLQASLPTTSSLVRQPPQSFQMKYTETVKLNYLLYLPDGYAASQKKWPLVLFLHGAGERGSDLTQLTAHGLPEMIGKQEKSFPFIVVSPQCPARDSWTSDREIATLDGLLDNLEARYRIDKDRVYATGLSMGGMGTWRLAVEFPDRFAAIVPMSGGGDPAKAKTIAHIPTWVFHGMKDTTVPFKASQDMVDALKAAGADVKFTAYPEAGHDCWTEAYNTPDLYDWMLQQKRTVKK
jgi:predicted peptidase